jgi:hypothetical protein
MYCQSLQHIQQQQAQGQVDVINTVKATLSEQAGCTVFQCDACLRLNINMPNGHWKYQKQLSIAN